MKAVVVEKYGDPDVLTLVDIPAPHAGQGGRCASGCTPRR